MVQAFTVNGFAEAYGLSRSFVYKLWTLGEGPDYYVVRKKRYIPYQAALLWQEARSVTKPASRALAA